MTLQAKIEENRRRHARYKKAERLLRKIRQRIFDYEDRGDEVYTKARRIMERCQVILAPLWRAERASAEDRKLQQTPSAFEPGCR
jgi:hypothetical protein